MTKETLTTGVSDGYQYKVVQQDQGHFCGYVQTNFTPPWTYDDLRGYMSHLIDVHGGLTYGPDEDGWVGFDCAHAGDVCVIDGEEQTDFAISSEKVWTVGDVEDECERLAEQVDVLENFAEKFDDVGWGND